MDELEQQIRDAMAALGLTRPDAEAYVAFVNGKTKGDSQEVGDGDGSGED